MTLSLRAVLVFLRGEAAFRLRVAAAGRRCERGDLDLDLHARIGQPDHHHRGGGAHFAEGFAHRGPAALEVRGFGHKVVHADHVGETGIRLFQRGLDVLQRLLALRHGVILDGHVAVIVPVVPETKIQSPSTTARE